MADSPFAPPEDEALAYGSLGSDPGSMPEMPEASGPDLTKQRANAALAALASIALFTPTGKLLGLASKPLGKALIGGGIGAGVAALGDGARGQEAFQSPMHELQARLKKQGLYQGPVDGTSNPGGPTEKAVERLHKMFGEGEPLHVLRMIQDPRYREGEEAKKTEKDKLAAEKAKSDLGLAETSRKKALDEAVAKAAKEGESWGAFATRWAPYIIGGGLGGVAGTIPTLLARKGSQTAAREVEEFARKNFAGKAGAAPVGPKNVADKAAAVNTFWERGGAQAPFSKVTTSGELSPKSRQFQIGDQTPVGDLYKPSTMDRLKVLSTDALALGGAGADYLGTSALSEKNQRQADEARKRFAATQSAQDAVEATHAQGRSNLWAGASNAALPFAISYLAGRKFFPRKTAQPNMVAMQGADAQRLKVQDYLNRQPAGGPQSVIPHKGGAPAPISGGELKALPAPASSPFAGGVGPHTNQMALAAKAERGANTDKILSGAMAQRTQQLMQEHVNSFAKVVKDGPNAGKPLLSTMNVNKLQRLLEQEHGMPISNHRLRKILRDAGVILA